MFLLVQIALDIVLTRLLSSGVQTWSEVEEGRRLYLLVVGGYGYGYGYGPGPFAPSLRMKHSDAFATAFDFDSINIIIVFAFLVQVLGISRPYVGTYNRLIRLDCMAEGLADMRT